MPQCRNCRRNERNISAYLRLCRKCIIDCFPEVKNWIDELHRESRKKFHLPEEIPKREGVQCRLCGNECIIPEGKRGFCGSRFNENSRIKGGINSAVLSYYYDPLPTNCVAEWVCSAREHDEGEFNLAVFYESCSYNCLFCQNWHYRYNSTSDRQVSVESLAQAVTEKTRCICFFGGDPSPQAIHAIKVSELCLKREKPVHICWETNGSENPSILKKMLELSLISGGCLKIDIKALTPEIHYALCGTGNERKIKNILLAGEWFKKRKEPPLFVASLLLVPHYIDLEEVDKISRFLSQVDPEIPLCLLAFYPHFYMEDMTLLKREFAFEALERCMENGLKNVRIGNFHLLV